MDQQTTQLSASDTPQKDLEAVTGQANGNGRKKRLRELTIFASVILGIVVFGLLNSRFLTKESAMAILLGASTDGLVVIGMTIVIVCGGFDLSVGSTMAAGGLTTGLLLLMGWPVWLAVLAGMMVGLVIGWLNGTIITRLKINPFITTLGMMSVVRGIVLVATKTSYPTGFPETFKQIAWGDLFGIPYPILILAAATVVADLFLRHARYLRQVYFIGSNEDAAVLTGINVGGVKRMSFMLTGVLAAIAGIIITARGNALDPNEGVGAELRVISAVIVGGASLSGGRGTILGSFLGLLLMQILTTGLVFIDVAPEAQQIAVGIVLILAAVIDRAGPEFGRNLGKFFTQVRSKKMERILNVILVLSLAVVLVIHFTSRPDNSSIKGQSAGKPVSEQKYVAIAAVTGAPYWLDSKAGLTDKARELGVKVVFTGPPTVDVNAQMDCINRAIAQKVDGIIMIPMSDSIAPAINRAIEKGIPVVCADADAPSSKRYSFVGTGNYNAGYQGGVRLAEVIGNKGKVALLTIPGADNLRQRIQGYKDALKKHPGIEVVAVGNEQGSVTEGQKVCRAILQSNPDLAGFGCAAASGGQGAAVAVKEGGKVGKVKIVAMDRDPATLKYIDEGVIDSSVAQRTYTMTYIALQMLYNLRNEQMHLVGDWKKLGINPLPPVVDTGSFLITRDNYKHFANTSKEGN